MSDQFKMTGVIKAIGSVQHISEKFSKREFAVTVPDEKYPQHVAFQCTQDKCELLNNFMEGQEVEVSFNLRGREWTSPQGEVKYFNTLEAWRIEAVGLAPAPAAAPAAVISEADEDLPF